MSVLMLMVALVMGACYSQHIEPEPLFTAEDFPLKVGNWWRYRLTDDYNNEVDTLLMRIAWTTKMGKAVFTVFLTNIILLKEEKFGEMTR